MRTFHPARALAARLALLATLFGGLFYGAGNMLVLATVPGFASVLHGDHVGDHGAAADVHDCVGDYGSVHRTADAPRRDPGDHRHDHHPGAPVDGLGCGEGDGIAKAPPTDTADHELLGIPAHCMFCLDGVVPAPVDLAVATFETERPLTPHLQCEPAPAAAAPVHDPRQSRGPPLRLV